MKRVLVVDDDPRMRRTLQIVIRRMGLESAVVANASEAHEQLAAARFDLIVTDLKLPGKSGIELLDEIRAEHRKLPVILVTAYATIETAIEAMRKGASDYVLKPFDNKNLELVIRKALDLERLRSENVFLREQVGETWAEEDFFAPLPSMQGVSAIIERVAPSASPVLVTGETGTGKELAARRIHAESPRRDALFVPLNCAALPGELLEAELFGHARGAFTGADRERRGKFEVADGGTLFLDEIGDMPPSLQAKLLRVLEDSTVQPLGTNKVIRVDVRIVSATNQDLGEAIATKRFRSDLFYRLNTFEIHLPPLRERTEDIDILAPRFLDQFGRELGKGKCRLSEEALQVLRGYDWPGNIRELRNIMERAAVLSPGQVVTDRFIRSMIEGKPAGQAIEKSGLDETPSPRISLSEAVSQFERRLILRALDETSDNKAKAARRLGIKERKLWYKLKKYGL